MKRMAKSAIFGVLLAALGCTQNPAVPTVLHGAGSTFVYPLMVSWTHRYEGAENGCKIEYRSLGSSAGIKFILDKEVDFGCTDSPMTDAQLEEVRKNGGTILHIPLILGAVVPVYNVPGVTAPLKFTGPVLARIYLGKEYPGEDKILKWNHPAIKDLNPGVELPNQEIHVVHRRDGSGTTGIWTDYLTKVSPEWAKVVGPGQEVKWPTGNAEVGNDGVAKYVQENSGSIGYVELAYAYQMDLAFGLVQNQEKEFVRANLASITKAAENSVDKFPNDMRYMIDDAPGKGSYPISGMTWAVVYVNQPPGKGSQLVHFLNWALSDEGQEVGQLFYARLPEKLAVRAREQVKQIQVSR